MLVALGHSVEGDTLACDQLAVHAGLTAEVEGYRLRDVNTGAEVRVMLPAEVLLAAKHRLHANVSLPILQPVQGRIPG